MPVPPEMLIFSIEHDLSKGHLSQYFTKSQPLRLPSGQALSGDGCRRMGQWRKTVDDQKIFIEIYDAMC